MLVTALTFKPKTQAVFSLGNGEIDQFGKSLDNGITTRHGMRDEGQSAGSESVTKISIRKEGQLWNQTRDASANYKAPIRSSVNLA